MSSLSKEIPPRVYCIQAREAPIAVVFARGPSDWWQIFQWWIDEDRLEPGAWYRGRLYPRRCDISPDGRLLFYFAVRYGQQASWPPNRWSGQHDHGSGFTNSFTAISRIPYLSALVAREEIGTWFGGGVFLPPEEIEAPRADSGPDGRLYGGLSQWWPSFDSIPEAEQRRWQVLCELDEACGFERVHGWNRVGDGRADSVAILGDTNQPTKLQFVYGYCRKPRPGGAARLRMLRGTSPELYLRDFEDRPVLYLLDRDEELPVRVQDAVWADWSRRGDLLVATDRGTIERRVIASDGIETVWSHDLNGRTPDPQPAPEWAKSWTHHG